MAGAGYKLFATGDVLTAAQVNTYLQEQTVMVFANAAARTTALSGVLAEGMMSYLQDTDLIQYYSGSAWVTVNTDQTPLTTKGDLFTYSTQDARLAVGNNGETLVADSSASTGLRWTATPSASNPVLNSAMQIWQRGTSISVAASGAGYTADRWYLSASASNNMTISRQATSDTTNLPFIQYCARIQRNSGQTGTGAMNFAQSFESINSIPFAGKTVTYSFYARAGANHSAGALTIYLVGGTGTDQNWVVSGYTGQSIPVNSTATLTTTWQRFTYTGTVASTVTELTALFQFTPSGTAGANDYWEVTGLQIDVGNTALPFRTNGGTLAGELAAAEYYYQKSYRQGTNPGTATELGRFMSSSGTNNSNWNAFSPKLHRTMRVAPTITIYDDAGNAGKVTTLAQNSGETDNVANTPAYIGTGSFGIFINLSAQAGIACQWVAEAEL